MLGAFIFCWVFDLKAGRGQQWLLPLQMGFFVTTMVILIAAIFMRGRSYTADRFSISYLGILIFVVVSNFSGLLLFGNAPSRVVANDATLIILFAGIFLVDNVRLNGGSLLRTLQFVIVSAFVATYGRLLLVMLLHGVNLSTERYAVLCGALPVGVAYVLTRIFASLRMRDLVFVPFQIGIGVISATRTVLVEASVAMFLLLLLFRGGKASKYTRGGKGRSQLAALGAAVTIALALYGALTLLPGDQLERWQHRISAMFVPSDPLSDPSGLSRKALLAFQFTRLTESTTAQVVGYGIAAEEGQGGIYAAYLSLIGVRGIDIEGFGDNVYTSAVYLGGLIGGGSFVFIMLTWGVWSLGAIRQVRRCWGDEHPDLLVPPLAIIISLIGCALGGEMNDRMFAMFFGLSVGLLLWIVDAGRNNVSIDQSTTYTLGSSSASPSSSVTDS